MKKTTLFIVCLAISLAGALSVQAQVKFDVPKNPQFKTAEDYTKHEPDIINAAKWLEETDLDKQTSKRQDVNAFVLMWVTGSPTVEIEITEQLGKIYGKNAQLLGMYIASYTRHFLENKGTATKTSATKAALISMMAVYKKDIEITKSKEMDKLIKATDENKLDEYIADKFK